MTPRPIGYYVHHHGAGHLSRARVIREATSLPVTLLGSQIDADARQDPGLAMAPRARHPPKQVRF